MKFALAVLVACLLVAHVGASERSEKQAISRFHGHRERTGHFAEYPFTDVYKTYVAAFRMVPGRDMSDNRNYVPSGEECITILRQFVSDDYTLNDVVEFVPLDACLGYLYQSEYREEDMEQNEELATDLPQYVNDPRLRELFESTHIDEYNNRAKDCIGNLLLDSIKVKKQYKDVDCNHDWLDLFNKFANCHNSIPDGARDSDSYTKLLYELVRLRGNKCFKEVISILNRAVYNEYSSDIVSRIKNNIFRTSINRQASDEGMPKPIMDLLTAIEQPKTQLNLREVSGILKGVVSNQVGFKDRFLKNMAITAQKSIKPKRKSKEQSEDPTGSKRYTKMVDNLCRFFRPTTHPDYYDFATPFVRMVRMLKFPEIFGITMKEFRKSVLRGYQIVPLYLSVSSCNILTYTEGFFVSQPENKPLEYRVTMKPNLDQMVQWPVASFY